MNDLLTIFYGFTMDLLRMCYGFTKGVLRICYVFATDLLMICYQFIKDVLFDVLWIYYIVAMYLQRIYTGFTMDLVWID